ncbi:MAG: YkvA family protein [Saprospiraceae bacterium]
MKNVFAKYVQYFSEAQLWKKLQNYTKQAGMKVVYSALLLFYAYKRTETPSWAKRIVIGALGYFISPFDMLPDLTPLIGYTDDIGILSFGIVAIAAYINDDVRTNARERLEKWFGEIDESEIAEVDKQL